MNQPFKIEIEPRKITLKHWQQPPEPQRTIWIIAGDRGCGKSTAGANFIAEAARKASAVLLVGRDSDHLHQIMVPKTEEAGKAVWNPLIRDQSASGLKQTLTDAAVRLVPSSTVLVVAWDLTMRFHSGCWLAVAHANQPFSIAPAGKSYAAIWCDDVDTWVHPTIGGGVSLAYGALDVGNLICASRGDMALTASPKFATDLERALRMLPPTNARVVVTRSECL